MPSISSFCRHQGSTHHPERLVFGPGSRNGSNQRLDGQTFPFLTVQTVAVRRESDADVDAVPSTMSNVEPFMRAAGFDSVAVDGDEITVRKEFGVTGVELRLERFDVSDVDFA